MSGFTKVAWFDGLYLRPQHFQQQERYLERYVETFCSALRAHAWGCTELEIERGQLASGRLVLRSVSGVFPDGTPFRMPDDHPLPAALEPDTRLRGETIYLAAPLRTPTSLDVLRGTTDEIGVRHKVEMYDARDTTASSPSTAKLDVSALRTRLLPASGLVEGFTRIPVAHVVEVRADKKIVLDDEFVPTVLDVRAAPALTSLLAELLGLLHQRGDALAGQPGASGRTGASELAEFFLLQTLNRYEPLMAHLAEAGSVHPEELYRVCIALAGELATFLTVGRRPPRFPTYRHDALRESFAPVVVALREYFAAVIQRSAVHIPIEAKKYGLHVARVPDRSLFGSAVFVLAARADMPSEELRRLFPMQLAIGPADMIQRIVNLSVRGVPVQALPVAPRQIELHAGFVYFEIDQRHELWAQLAASGAIVLHVPETFPGLALELWAVRA